MPCEDHLNRQINRIWAGFIGRHPNPGSARVLRVNGIYSEMFLNFILSARAHWDIGVAGVMRSMNCEVQDRSFCDHIDVSDCIERSCDVLHGDAPVYLRNYWGVIRLQEYGGLTAHP